jgi:hypothetical protein
VKILSLGHSSRSASLKINEKSVDFEKKFTLFAYFYGGPGKFFKKNA